MPRDIPVGNGRLLITFDSRYQVRDIYYPHVGQENHAGDGPCRFGVYADVPTRHRSRLYWTTDEGWTIRQRYLRDTLTTSVSLEHRELRLSMYCNDAVDFHRPVFVRKIRLKNLSPRQRMVQVIHHQDFNMLGTKVGDTAYFDPELRSIIHYRAKRYMMVTFFGGGEQRIDEFATGTSGFQGAEGTWRDAEDGHLQGNPIAQGAVDSCIAHHVHLGPDEQQTIYMVIIAGESRQELAEQHRWLMKNGPQGVIDRTTAYWRLWVGGTNINFGNLPPKVVDLFKRSLLVIRTQIDNNGAIIAANDSDVMQFSRDTYSYMWPRDGALVANALDLAGFSEITRWFYTFCKDLISPEGYFHHKYNPDGSPASSWHPWVLKGHRVLPIQEDETALVVWALWRHYYRYRDIEFVRPLWVDVVQKAADFMVRYRDPHTHLPLPSYDLWEERWGVHAFTVAAVHGALKAARNFAVCFGERQKAEQYHAAADEIRAAAAKHLFVPRLNRFVRRLIPRDCDSQQGGDGADKGEPYEIDETVDASLFGIYAFHLFDADDPRVEATMRAVHDRLWVRTKVGGVARYEGDSYHRISEDPAVPGNPWFICTLWLADYIIARAQTPAQLKEALPIFEWAAAHALESGVLAEQVNPYTNVPLSVSPLTWSHATVVNVVIRYLEKLEQLQICDHCHQPVYRLRRRGPVEVRAVATFDQLEAAFEPDRSLETLTADTHFLHRTGENGAVSRVRLAIDTADCIGCGICVVHCDQEILTMVDGKAMIDSRTVNRCDLDARCVEVCPTDVVKLTVETDPKVTA